MPNPPAPPPTLTLVSSFMQNYDCGTNLSSIAPAPESLTPFVADNGTLNFLTPGDDGSLLRIYQDPHSTSGYSVQKVYGEEMRRSDNPVNPGTQPAMTAARAVVLPGHAGTPGQLIYVRPSNPCSLLIRWDLAADGRIGTQRDGYFDYVGALALPYCGNLWPETRYLLEFRADSSAPRSYRMGLRSLADFSFIPVDSAWPPALPSPFWQGTSTLRSDFDTRVFPLRSSNPDVFRYLYINDTGSALPVMLTRSPGGTTFRQAGERFAMFGRQPGHVHEAAPGKIQAVFANPQARPYLDVWTGTYDPASSAPISWTRDSPQLPAGGYPAASPGVTEDLLTSWDPHSSTITTFLARSNGSPPAVFETWATVLGGPSQQPMAPFGATPVTFLPTGRVTMLVQAAGSYQVWDRAADGAYDVHFVDADWGNPASTPTACYRVGLTLTRNSVPAAGEAVGINTSEPARALVNGSYVMLGIGRPRKITADATGMIWVTIYISDRLSFPHLRVSLAGVTQVADFALDAKMQQFFASVSDATLQNARDPHDGSVLIPDPASAARAAGTIRQLVAAVPAKPPAAALAAIPAVSVTSDVPLHWLNAPYVQAGYDANVAGLIQPMGWLTDKLDWFEDEVGAVWNGIVSVANIVINAASVTLTIVIDGVQHVFEGVVSTFARAMDGVTFILTHVGLTLGKAIRWLLSKIGFLFDWEAILAKRDTFKRLVRTRLTSVTGRMTDPKTACTTMLAELDTLKGQATQALASLRTQPSVTTTFGSRAASGPSLGSMMSTATGSVAAEVTWLFEKVSAVLPGLGVDLGTPDIDAKQAIQDLATAMTSVDVNVTTLLSDVQTAIGSLLTDPQEFLGSSLTVLVDLVIGALDALFAILRAILTAAGDFLHALYAKPAAMINWLDQPLSAGFFGGFYEGLTENPFSLFDVVALVAAFEATLGPARVTSAAASGPVRPMTDGDAQDELRAASRAFLFTGCIINPVAATISAALPGKNPWLQRLDIVCTVVAQSCNLGGEICLAWETHPSELAVLETGFLSEGAMAAGILAVALPAAQKDKLITAGTVAFALYAVIRAGLAWGLSEQTALYESFTAMQSVVAAATRFMRPMGASALDVGFIQGILSTGRLVMHPDT